MKKSKSTSRIILVSIVAVFASIFALGYFIYNSVGSQAKENLGKTYYWHYESTPRYCYDPNDPSTCHYGNLSTKAPKNAQGYIKVHVKKGGSCPKGDYQIINETGTVIDCFGGTRETNTLFKKLK